MTVSWLRKVVATITSEAIACVRASECNAVSLDNREGFNGL